MASDLKKPMGITVIRKKILYKNFYHCLLKICLVLVKKTYPKLMELGILTIGDFIKEEHKDKILSLMSESAYLGYIDHILGKK